MIEGIKTYYLPYTDIEVEVTYEVDCENIVFKYAEIDGQDLACELLGLQIDVTQKNDLQRINKYITLKTWLQSKLDNDFSEILVKHEICVKSDYDEHFNQGSFV